MAKRGTSKSSRQAQGRDPRESLERSGSVGEWWGDEQAPASTALHARAARGGGGDASAADPWPGPLDGSDVRALTTCDLNR